MNEPRLSRARRITQTLGNAVLRPYWRKNKLPFVGTGAAEPSDIPLSKTEAIAEVAAAATVGGGLNPLSLNATIAIVHAEATPDEPEEGPPVSTEPYEYAAKYVALQHSVYIGYVLHQLQNLLLCFIGSFVLLVAALNSFSFQTPQAIFRFLMVMLVIGAVAVVRVFAQMERDPILSRVSGWLEKMANKQVVTGTRCHHISNNAPRNICDLDAEKRKQGVVVAQKWLDGAAMLGAKSMRVNSGGPRIAPTPAADPSSYPKNLELARYLSHCIESFKEMADYGGKLGVKVTLENHWGLTANPINIRIIIEEVNNPFCEASPDFCNWEHEYLLFHGLQDLAPYAHTNVHAKYWDRWKDPDVQRNLRIMLNSGYTGLFAWNTSKGAGTASKALNISTTRS